MEKLQTMYYLRLPVFNDVSLEELQEHNVTVITILIGTPETTTTSYNGAIEVIYGIYIILPYTP